MSQITVAFLAILLNVPFLAYELPLVPPAVSSEVSANAWKPEPGDGIIIDTLENVGYLLHADGRYVRFPVVTGQRRNVYYIGRSYFGATPNREWVVRSMDIKSDRVTFGPSGRFLRLFNEAERTAYGFHEHRDEQKLFSEFGDERFRSMGCIIVQTAIMDLLVSTFEQSGEVPVRTIHGFKQDEGVMAARRELLKNGGA